MFDSNKELAKPLTTFISFPSPYTQSLIIQALVSTLPDLSLSLAPFPEDSPPALQWYGRQPPAWGTLGLTSPRADYDFLSFTLPHSHPTAYLTSSYVYRKALIRKHQLHLTISEYLAKVRHRRLRSVLENGGVPRGWVVELQFADELDELMRDELFELGGDLCENESRSEELRKCAGIGYKFMRMLIMGSGGLS